MDIKRGYWWIVALAAVGAISFLFDRPVLNLINLTQNIVFDKVLALFDPIYLYAFLFLLVAILLIIKKDKKMLMNFGLAMILTLLVVFFIKLLIARERPFELAEFIMNTNIQDYSFPSNHSAVIFAMLPFLIKVLRKLKGLWITLAVLVCFERAYFGIHYVSDIIFGALIGFLISEYMLTKYQSNKVIRKKKAKRKAKKKKF